MANEKKIQLIRYPQGRVACVRGEIVSILACANFSIKNTKLKEIDKRILENRDNEFYTDISKKHNKLKLGGMIANEQY